MTKTSVKVLALITCFSALPLMVGLTGCAGDRYKQSTGHPIDANRAAEPSDNQSADPRMEDRRTAERVREALAASADYKYDGLQVTACKGIVQLGGLVNTSAQRNRAAEATSKVVGVKDVVNNIAVRE